MRNKFLKRIAYILAFISSIASAAAVAFIPPSPKVTLSWDYPLDQLGTNLTFKIYHTDDMNVPVADWTVLTNVLGINLSVNLPLNPGAHFFAITASNDLGESGFATIAP